MSGFIEGRDELRAVCGRHIEALRKHGAGEKVDALLSRYKAASIDDVPEAQLPRFSLDVVELLKAEWPVPVVDRDGAVWTLSDDQVRNFVEPTGRQKQ